MTTATGNGSGGSSLRIRDQNQILDAFQVAEIVTNCELPPPWQAHPRFDHDQPYLKVTLGDRVILPRYYMPANATPDQVLHTVYLAVRQAQENLLNHEFRYCGQAVFDPAEHIDKICKTLYNKSNR